jgi:hypothetical protein
MSYAPMQHVQVIVPEPPSNGLGVAGFVISLLSILLCGLTSPIGLLVSLVALAWRPRGLAAAGVILGGVGSLWLFAFGLTILAGILGLGAAANVATEAERQMEIERQKAKAVNVAPEQP